MTEVGWIEPPVRTFFALLFAFNSFTLVDGLGRFAEDDCPEDYSIFDRTGSEESCKNLLYMKHFPYGYSTNVDWCQFIIYQNYSVKYKLANGVDVGCSARAEISKMDNWDMCKTLLKDDDVACFENGKKRIQWITPQLTSSTSNEKIIFIV